MTYDEAIEYIHGISWTFCKPGLDRISELCEKLGNPERSLKFIHVAGTNGKGSFSSMLSSVLTHSGYKTGLFTSPYIVRFNERMKVDGADIQDTELAKITEYVKPLADSMTDKPTEFELITAIGFEYFKRHGVDLVVLEAGMGGRLDSTNIIKTPILSVITGVALDHVAFLGDTVEEIAGEKAGIIKEGVPVLFGGEDNNALEVIKKVAESKNAPLYLTERDSIVIKKMDLSGTVMSYKSHEDISIKLLGGYQPYNTANVLEAIDTLRDRGYQIPESAVKIGLSEAKWPARFEIISHAPLIIYDGAHNAEGITAAKKSIKRYFGDKKVTAISGVLRDKDYEFIAGELSEICDLVYTITPDNPRALTKEEYGEILREKGVKALPSPGIDEAVSSAIQGAKSSGVPIVVLGSLYIYGEVLANVKKHTSEE